MNLVELHAAAFHFVKDPTATAEDIATAIGVSKRTIERWATTDAWHDALDALDYTGTRDWRGRGKKQPDTDAPPRNAGLDFERVKTTYFSVLAEGVHPRNAAKRTAQRTGVNRRRIDRWVARYGWRKPEGRRSEKTKPQRRRRRPPLSHDPTSGNSEDY